MWSRFVAVFSRLRFVLTRGRLCDETSHELRSHLELLTARYIGSGMAPDEARAAAHRQLGNLVLLIEDIYQMNSIRWLDALGQDIRYAVRVFGRNPAFVAIVTVTLALGIGANTAMLSIVYSVLLKPLPYAEPEQIYSVEVIVPERREQIPSLPATVQTYFKWRSEPTVFSGMSAVTPWEASITGDGEPERLGGARVSANFFSFLGVSMARGRSFSAEEEQSGKETVVVISDKLWRRRFGSDPAVVGRTMVINGVSHLVVGIAAQSLLVPTGSQLHPLLPFASRIDIWKPIARTSNTLNNESWDHGVLVRLADGASLEHGRQQLAAILTEMARAQMPKVKTEIAIRLVPVREVYAGKARLQLLLILAASVLLLLTACASIANVFLARVASRTNEFATRIALGAGPGRILSQTLTETILLAILGGAIGAVLGKYGASLLAFYGPDDVRLLGETPFNVRFLLFSMAVSLTTGLICGIVPAWYAHGREPGAELKEAGRASGSGRRAGRSREVLVGVEIALATVLLASAGLLLHSFLKVMETDRGYEVERVLTSDLSLFGERYSAADGRVAFYRALLENVRGLPGVVAAGAISNLPALSVFDGASRTIFYPRDTDFQGLVLARPVAVIRSVTAGYFAASGSSLVAGRLLADEEPIPTAVISESLASRLWPGKPPAAIVGQQLRQGDVTGPLITVAGMVTNARPGGLDREPSPAIYRPYRQWPSGAMTLVVRTAQDPATLAVAVRSEIRKLDPNLPISAMRTMREIVSETVAQRRFQMALTSVFALVALLLGAVGVYGVVSYAVACRTRDIGLRIALGAFKADVMRWVFAHGMRPVLIGLGAGLIGVVAIANVLRSLLFEIAPADPLSLGGVVLVLLLSSGLACYLPARRAAAMDPMIALRHE
jgi:putative ABC transport system permease protein